MIPEEVRLRLMTYFFEVSVDDDFYSRLGATLNEIIYHSELFSCPVTEDELVSVGVKLINEYLEI